MSLDYRAMTGSDWLCLCVIPLLCVIIFWGAWFKPARPWQSVQRLRNPDAGEEQIGEPTKVFVIACRVFGALILLLGVAVLLLPFLPLLK